MRFNRKVGSGNLKVGALFQVGQITACDNHVGGWVNTVGEIRRPGQPGRDDDLKPKPELRMMNPQLLRR